MDQDPWSDTLLPLGLFLEQDSLALQFQSHQRQVQVRPDESNFVSEERGKVAVNAAHYSPLKAFHTITISSDQCTAGRALGDKAEMF